MFVCQRMDKKPYQATLLSTHISPIIAQGAFFRWIPCSSPPQSPGIPPRPGLWNRSVSFRQAAWYHSSNNVRALWCNAAIRIQAKKAEGGYQVWNQVPDARKLVSLKSWMAPLVIIPSITSTCNHVSFEYTKAYTAGPGPVQMSYRLDCILSLSAGSLRTLHHLSLLSVVNR